MSNIELRYKVLIAVCMLILLTMIIPAVLLNISFAKAKSKYRKMENYYYSNKESFDEIASYFKSLYADGLYIANFNAENGSKVDLIYKRKSDLLSEPLKKDVIGEKFVSALTGLRDKYQYDIEHTYSVFSYIEAYYDDDGDMLLVMNAYSESLKSDEDRTSNIYLVYADENYTGKRSFIDIDGRVKLKKSRLPINGALGIKRAIWDKQKPSPSKWEGLPYPKETTTRSFCVFCAERKIALPLAQCEQKVRY